MQLKSLKSFASQELQFSIGKQRFQNEGYEGLKVKRRIGSHETQMKLVTSELLLLVTCNLKWFIK
jgi:hypothetical protein